MRPVSPETRAAYEKAQYVVFALPEIVLRIGEASAGLDELLEADGVRTAAYLTAANPRGEPASRADNDSAAAALHDALLAEGYLCYGGEGRDPEGRWTPEPSLLVLGISRARASELGRQFEQNAIVFVERGRAPELLMLSA
jgi:hypothetical protein